MSRGPKKQFDRDAVLDTAMHVFWAQGYEATGMASLLDAMGIGRQSLYDTFGSKRELFMASLRRYAETRLGMVTRLLRSEGSPIANVYALLDFFLDDTIEGEHQGCLLGNTFAELGARDEELASFLGRCLRVMEETLYEALEQARASGELAAHTSTRDLAASIVTTLQGLALVTKVRDEPELARAVIRTLRSTIDHHRALPA